MRLSATVDYSAVTAGAIQFKLKMYSKVKLALEELAMLANADALSYLKESYKTKPGRPDFARTGTLERAVFTSVNLGMAFPGGIMSGIGDIDQLYAQAPYWDMVEEGSEEYVNQEVSGFWVDSSGQHYGPSARYPMDKFVGGAAINFTIKTPIQAHNFYKDTAGDMRSLVMPVMLKYILGALG